MQENNVKLGEIRLEESFHEAKISKPNALHSSQLCHKKSVEQNDEQRESPHLLPIQGVGAEYREG